MPNKAPRQPRRAPKPKVHYVDIGVTIGRYEGDMVCRVSKTAVLMGAIQLSQVDQMFVKAFSEGLPADTKFKLRLVDGNVYNCICMNDIEDPLLQPEQIKDFFKHMNANPVHKMEWVSPIPK
jgi:hypothetical protein